MKYKTIIIAMLTMLMLVGTASADLTDGILHYYKLNGDATDAHSNFDLNVTGGTFPAGKISTGYDIDGGDFLSGSGPTSNLPTDQFSYNFWIDIQNSGQAHTLMSRQSGAGFANPILYYWFTSSNTMTMYGGTGIAQTAAPLAGIDEGVGFKMMTIIRNGTSLYVYLDGVFQDNNVATVVPSDDTSRTLFIGIDQGSFTPSNYLIDEFGMWDRVINKSEIEILYNAGVGITYPFTSNAPPTAGQIDVPTNLSVVSGNTAVNWSGFEDSDGDALSFDVLVSSDSFATNISVATNVFTNYTTFNSNSLAQGPWEMVVVGSDSEFSAITPSITIYSDNTVGAGVMTAPTNNSIVGNGNVTFTWSGFTDPSSDPLNYTLIITNGGGTFQDTVSVSTTIVYDTSSVPDGVYDVYVEGNDSFGNVNQTASLNLTFDNTAPVIALLYPAAEGFFSNGLVNLSCTDVSAIVSYDVNDTRFDLIGSPSAPAYNFTNTTSTIGERFEFSCVDVAGNNGTSALQFNFDVNTPTCLGNTDDQSLDFGSVHLWNVTCFDDLNLFLVNISCFKQSGAVQKLIFADNINSTAYNILDSTGTMLEDVTCEWTAADAHTKNDIRGIANRFNTQMRGNRDVDVPNARAIVSYKSAKNPTFASLNYDVKDRIKFSYAFAAPSGPAATQLREYDFFVNSQNSIEFIGNTDEYKAWFVVDNAYWVDFNLPGDANATYDVVQINRTSYAVSISTMLDSLEFESVGLLNINQFVQEFTISPEPGTDLVVNECPSTTAGSLILFIVAAIALFMIFAGLMFNINILGVFGALMLLVISWTLMGCSTGIGIVMIGISVIMTVWFTMRGFV